MSVSHSAFASRDFRVFLASRLMSALGHQMEVVAIGWLVYSMTESAFALGLIGLASFAPVFLMTIPAGHAADRFDRRLISILCYLAVALGSFGLIVAAIIGKDALYAVYAIAALLGTARDHWQRRTLCGLCDCGFARHRAYICVARHASADAVTH